MLFVLFLASEVKVSAFVQGGTLWSFPLVAGRRVGGWAGDHCGCFLCQIWVHRYSDLYNFKHLWVSIWHLYFFFKMFFCVMTMSWRGGASLSFCISCPHGRAVTGGPSIFTQQTVSIPLLECVPFETQVCLHILVFSILGHFQPQSIAKSLVPSWNTLVLFEVSPVSFHQVSRSALLCDCLNQKGKMGSKTRFSMI